MSNDKKRIFVCIVIPLLILIGFVIKLFILLFPIFLIIGFWTSYILFSILGGLIYIGIIHELGEFVHEYIIELRNDKYCIKRFSRITRKGIVGRKRYGDCWFEGDLSNKSQILPIHHWTINIKNARYFDNIELANNKLNKILEEMEKKKHFHNPVEVYRRFSTLK